MKTPEYYRAKGYPLGMTPDSGCFLFPHFRINGYEIFVIASNGLGWEHVSVSVRPQNKNATRCPTWEEMCWVKDQFWDKDKAVVQYHPAESDYVSMHPFCLHLWRPTDKELPTPDPLMVGPRSFIKQ